MFSKPQTKGAAAPLEAAPARRIAVASLVAEGVTFRGDFTTEDDLHLDGVVEGDLSVGRLTIGERGAVSGTIHAESVEIRGRISGTITARQVRLYATARVDGDITHTELSIESGAHFEGRSLVFAAPEAEAPALSVVAAE